jgi:hypothetical protein
MDYADQISKKVSNLNVDIVFSPGTIPIAFLECNKPIVFWTDASFGGMIDFYPRFCNLCKKSFRDGHFMEASALKRAKLAIYSSGIGGEYGDAEL